MPAPSLSAGTCSMGLCLSGNREINMMMMMMMVMNDDHVAAEMSRERVQQRARVEACAS